MVANGGQGMVTPDGKFYGDNAKVREATIKLCTARGIELERCRRIGRDVLLVAQHPIHAGPPNTEFAGDFRGSDVPGFNLATSAACRRAVGMRPL